MDAALIQTGGRFDIALDGPDLKHDDGLRTTILISLFTDARAHEDDVLPSDDGDRRGHWADSFSETSLGSRLWLLEREKTLDDVLQRAQEYASEALEWLIDDDIAEAINVTTDWFETGKLGIYITLTKGDGSTWQDTFNYELKAA
ncbi:MAG: phage GP46 family protein [Cycloclasticus sp.]